jgi:hypothetical protein
MQIIGQEPILSNPDFGRPDRAGRNHSTGMDFSRQIGNNTIW